MVWKTESILSLISQNSLQIREINSNWLGHVTESRDSLQSWLDPDTQTMLSWVTCWFCSQPGFSPMVDPTTQGLCSASLINPVKRNLISKNSSKGYTGLNLIPKLGTPKLGLWLAKLGFLGILEGADFDQPHLNCRTESKGRNQGAVTRRERWRLIRQSNKCVPYVMWNKIHHRWIFLFYKGFHAKIPNGDHKIKGYIINHVQKLCTFQIFRNSLSFLLHFHINSMNYIFWNLSCPALLTKKSK